MYGILEQAGANFVNGFRAIRAPQRNPADPVMAAYPPLRNYGCFTLPGAANPWAQSCAEKVLMIALQLRWHDEHGHKPVAQQPPQPAALETRAVNGLTPMEMTRRLQRLSLRDMPVYWYHVVNNRFELYAGKPRKDNYAIVFVPADPPALPNAHWTFATVLHVEMPEADLVREMVVYSQYPMINDPIRRRVFWRAAVTAENKREYETMRALGLACDCVWQLRCHHEENFVALCPNGADRVTLDGEEHVVGTKFGQLAGSVVPAYRVTRTEQGGMKVVTPAGTEIRRKYTCTNGVVKATTWLAKLLGAAQTDSFAKMIEFGTVVVMPYRVRIQEFEDEFEIDQITDETPMNILKRGALEVFKGRTQSVVPLEIELPNMAWGTDADLNIQLPRKAELMARLAARKEGSLNADNILDTLRRISAEEGWKVSFDNEELQVWLKRTVTEVGQQMALEGLDNRTCWNCLECVKTHWHMCKRCKRKSRELPPEPLCLWDTLVTHVGFRPLWSKEFVPPVSALKADVEIRYVKTKKLVYQHTGDMNDVHKVFAHFRKQVQPITCRGYLRGPMFLNQEPTCFPRGTGTAGIAFLIRLGTARLHAASLAFYRQMYEWLIQHTDHVYPIEPESWEYFIEHFSGDKKQKMLEARQEDVEGWAPQVRRGEMAVKMSGFTKAEKSYNFEYTSDGYLSGKKTEKPRFICSPNPVVLSEIGRWTHAQTKWLAKEFTWRSNMYYAGCSTPEELNQWLNRTLDEIPDPWSLVDDISAMDSNHSTESFTFHKWVRNKQFPKMSMRISAMYDGEQKLKIRVGQYTFEVEDVNASGVSDTSYKNSLLCLVIRAFAIVHALVDLMTLTQDQAAQWVNAVVRQCCMAASGDDGLVRLPEVINGVHIRKFSMARYQAAWAMAGFGIKVHLVPPTRWRMATFLAMRPVWAGQRYEWAPEPARRMRGMFWQIDNSQHPMAWGRGIATQVLQQARALPVLSDVCEWYLRNTRGPVSTNVEATNRYSPFYGSVMSGGKTERSIAEFCLDYRVTVDDLKVFQNVLDMTADVLVNIDCFVLHRIYAEES